LGRAMRHDIGGCLRIGTIALHRRPEAAIAPKLAFPLCAGRPMKRARDSVRSDRSRCHRNPLRRPPAR
jgi:hypothetical protein